MYAQTEQTFKTHRKDWGTPQGIFDQLNEEFDFTMDACADHDNCKVEEYLTIEDNALMNPWSGRVWCNPPYGRNIIDRWIEKAILEIRSRRVELVAMLLPASTSSPWFHDYCMKGEIRFIRGRLKFEGAKYNAPFPSMIVIFRRGEA